MDESPELIQIKGIRDGLLASMGAADWNVLRATILAQIDARTSFFHGARMALDVGEQVLKVQELVELRDQLSERGVSLWAVVSESETTNTTAQLLGLATRISKPRPEESRHFSVEDLGEETALFLNRTLRGGTRIEFGGHVVVLGDVNPGAEIVAEGNVLVWGRARGLLHAGSKSAPGTVICGLDLAGAQLRIAGTPAPERELPKDARPEVATINEGGAWEFLPWPTGRTEP